MEEEEADISDIEMLAHYKQSGSWSDQCECQTPDLLLNPILYLVAGVCTNKSRLRAHMRDNYHICDLCDITFDTPIDLREHNKYIVDTPIDLREHNKAPKETAYSCDECGINQEVT